MNIWTLSCWRQWFLRDGQCSLYKPIMMKHSNISWFLKNLSWKYSIENMKEHLHKINVIEGSQTEVITRLMFKPTFNWSISYHTAGCYWESSLLSEPIRTTVILLYQNPTSTVFWRASSVKNSTIQPHPIRLCYSFQNQWRLSEGQEPAWADTVQSDSPLP